MNIKKSTKVGILSILGLVSISFMSVNLQNNITELETNISDINQNIGKISYRKNSNIDVKSIDGIFLDLNNKVIKIYSGELDKEIVLIYNQGTSFYLNQIEKALNNKQGKIIYKFFRSIDLLKLKTGDNINVIIKEDKISKRLIAIEITKTEDI